MMDYQTIMNIVMPIAISGIAMFSYPQILMVLTWELNHYDPKDMIEIDRRVNKVAPWMLGHICLSLAAWVLAGLLYYFRW